MAAAKSGDTVNVNYRGLFEDGTVFDSNYETEPFEFTLGENMVVPGFEKAVLGMEVGDEKTVTVPPEEAFGQPQEGLAVTVPKSSLPETFEPQVGMMLQVRAKRSQSVSKVTITAVTGDTVTLDGNHPLAGKTLTYEIELIAIVPEDGDGK
jgi:FKBP-type peptidyl-prolyl cis-trans isomerase 2